MSIAIVDLGCGNVGSVKNAFVRLGAETQVADRASVIAAADKLVLPGVGAAAFAMERLNALGLISVIRDFARPLLGICLGMQLLFESSEEGGTDCLGLIKGRVRSLAPLPGRRIPHMGWSKLEVTREGLGIENGDYYWFAHSFAYEDGPATFAYADDRGPIPAAVEQGNLLGCQFHPERSSKPGAGFLEAFLEK
jgi:glutamine amidotransferase